MGEETVNNSYVMAKNCYETQRIEQLERIKNFLEKSGDYTASDPGRNGANSYGVGRIRPSDQTGYDLSHWKYLDVTGKNNRKFLIFLQPFDRDPSSQNIHILRDCIGIYLYRKNDDTSDAFKRMLITEIDLPMEEPIKYKQGQKQDKFELLKGILDRLIDLWNLLDSNGYSVFRGDTAGGSHFVYHDRDAERRVSLFPHLRFVQSSDSSAP